ncbi:MAG: lysyl oxidase family protein [Bacteroidota bacterium]
MNKALLLGSFFATVLFSTKGISACGPGQSEVIVTIVPDNYPTEISWDLKDDNGTTIMSGFSAGDTACVPSGTCLIFTIYDSFGDGICCAYGNGSYTVTLDGVTMATGGNYSTQEQTTFNCPPGITCTSAINVSEGSYTAPSSDTWYTFTPDSMGMYVISTCDTSNTCDTKIWIYDDCNGLVWNQTNVGTLYYDDDAGGCGNLAQITAALDTAVTYIIRIGDDNGACGTDSIDWFIQYSGPISGCMDPSACNYNPMATVAGTCYYWPDVNCPPGPDLTVVQSTIESSLSVSDIVATSCQVAESCLTGYGTRRIINFTTHIKNIGPTDYYIGNPTNNPGQFTNGNCHGHWHYEGYAEYILYKTTGQPLPIGFKNGFCVLDLECSGGGTYQYGCGNMGISSGCGDIYSAGLDCQWIDITDVDPGDYILAVKVNWDQSPDALGRYETDYVNNWAQVCITIYTNVNGDKDIIVNATCPPYTDCMGVPYGNATEDCTGNCGGTVKMGDLDVSTVRDTTDSQLYVDGILANSLTPTTCNDLNDDGLLTVWDAALVTHCYNDYTNWNTACTFPYGVENINQTVTLMIDTVNLTSQYVDVWILNPQNKVIAYEFDMSGLNILDVQPLYPYSVFPEMPQFTVGGQKVMAISYVDSLIGKNLSAAPLCRIYYSSLTATQVCIADIVHIVNPEYEAVNTNITNGCVAVNVNVDELDAENYFHAWPNPSSGLVNISVNTVSGNGNITVSNTLGEKVYSANVASSARNTIDLGSFAAGTYFINYTNGAITVTKRIVLEK